MEPWKVGLGLFCAWALLKKDGILAQMKAETQARRERILRETQEIIAGKRDAYSQP